MTKIVIRCVIDGKFIDHVDSRLGYFLDFQNGHLQVLKEYRGHNTVFKQVQEIVCNHPENVRYCENIPVDAYMDIGAHTYTPNMRFDDDRNFTIHKIVGVSND